jgi:Uma2 family endonuclease
MNAPITRVPGRPLEPPTAGIPPLENGDHLTRAEFERRYAAMPAVKKAELIEGVVLMPSPVSYRLHGDQHFSITTWLGLYRCGTAGVLGGVDATVRLDMDNEFQPDVVLLIDPRAGGRARLDEDDYISGSPELVVEVASSSVSIDLGKKLNIYRRAGVQEYLVWRVRDGAIDWMIQRDGQYASIEKGVDGILRSTVFPGLWLDPEAMLASNQARVADVLRQGMASPEHAAFVAKLRLDTA